MLPITKKRTYDPSLANHFFGGDILSSLFSDGADYSVPAVNIKEDDKAFQIQLAAPGISKEAMSIKLDKDKLTISASNKNDSENKVEEFTKREFSFNNFKRTFSLPENINKDKISADYREGVLYVELPKVAENNKNKNRIVKIS